MFSQPCYTDSLLLLCVLFKWRWLAFARTSASPLSDGRWWLQGAGGDGGIVFAEWPFERWFIFCYVIWHEQSIPFGCVFIVRRGWAYEIGLADPVGMKIKLFARLRAISPLALKWPQYLLLLLLGYFFWYWFSRSCSCAVNLSCLSEMLYCFAKVGPMFMWFSFCVF